VTDRTRVLGGWAKQLLVSLACLMVFTPSTVHAAGTWIPFGPEVVVRSGGSSTTVTRTLDVLNRAALYLIEIRPTVARPSPQSTVAITVNGTPVLTLPLSSWLPIFVWPVRLNPSNQVVIELRGPRNDSVSVQIVGIDLDAPTITGTIAPPTPASGWFNVGPTVTFACADRTSGVASCTPPVLVGSEGPNQPIRGTVVDKAGRPATTSLAVSLDTTAPTITATLSPPPNASGRSAAPVTVSYNCTDALSGIRSCPSPTVVTASGSHTVAGVAVDNAGNQTSLNTTVVVATSLFTVRNYGGKCLDAGSSQPGGAVFLKTCDGSAGQQFGIEEMNPSHQVRLHAGSTVLGFHYDPAAAIDDGTGTGGSGVDPGPLRLQLPADAPSPQTNAQLFVLDGDSIIAAPDRSLVAQVENARGADGTPISLRKRRLADAEFWDLAAVDGSGAYPTTGFVRVETVCELLRYLPLDDAGQPPDSCPGPPATPAGPGTVINVPSGAVLDFAGLYPVLIPSGVTIRGGRRGTNQGARFCKALNCDENNPIDTPGTGVMLEVAGSDVRLTGLRLEGPSRRTDPDAPTTLGVRAHDGPDRPRTIIDHNDASGWTVAAIEVVGPDGNDPTQCDALPPLFSNVFVARNFLHHNREQEKGYGVVTGKGGFPLIEGNTFVANRHAIAAAGGGHTGYFAGFNLVLSEAPLQDGFGPFNWHTHDFDQHGNGDNGFGGIGGRYVNIYQNTFFGLNRANFEIRAWPCLKSDFSGNVSLVRQEDAVDFKIDELIPSSLTPAGLVVNIDDTPPQFNHDNPTDRLGVGDFDGDGLEDMFLATGAAWYYSPAGAREWRYLSGNPAPLAALRFGDFDGDGRTDVVAVGATAAGNKLLVSWGGVSIWDHLNDAPGPITDLAVGQFVSDFPGDRRDDLFWAEGYNWWVSSGGSVLFQATQTSSKRVSELRFGDFNADGVTDVFAIESGRWKVSYGATSTWTPLPVSLTNSVDNLIVADFDGDGRADVARASFLLNGATVNHGTLSFSHGGTTGWTTHTITPTSSCSMTYSAGQLSGAGLVAGIAKVDGTGGADLLLWGAKDSNNFCLVSNGTGAASRHSSQDMR